MHYSELTPPPHIIYQNAYITPQYLLQITKIGDFNFIQPQKIPSLFSRTSTGRHIPTFKNHFNWRTTSTSIFMIMNEYYLDHHNHVWIVPTFFYSKTFAHTTTTFKPLYWSLYNLNSLLIVTKMNLQPRGNRKWNKKFTSFQIFIIGTSLLYFFIVHRSNSVLFFFNFTVQCH